jgi:hypothetical protein
MSNLILTPSQVRHIIESQPESSNRQRVAALVERTGIPRPSWFRYMANGVTAKTPRVIQNVLLKLAAETGATQADESIAGVFI